MNKHIIFGRLGRDPEMRYLDDGNAVANFSVATDAWSKDKGKDTPPDWHRVVVWGKQAESCSQYLSKGSQVLIEGRAVTRKWEDKEGNDKYTTELVAQRVEFGPKASADENDSPADDSEEPF